MGGPVTREWSGVSGHDPGGFLGEVLRLVQLRRAVGVGLPGALVLKETWSWGPGMAKTGWAGSPLLGALDNSFIRGHPACASIFILPWTPAPSMGYPSSVPTPSQVSLTPGGL